VLNWNLQPLHQFNAAVSRSLEEMAWTLDHLSMDVVALGGRLARSEQRSAALAESLQEQLGHLHEQVKALVDLQKNANPEAPADRMATDGDKRAGDNSRFYIDTGPGNHRTAYVIGLFGTGRRYINELILNNIGRRAKYFRDMIRLHPGPTPMIYSGHATMKHVSRAQAPPAVMSSILEAVGSGFANLIFVYRHPLDSLLTNWIWWRTYIRDNMDIPGISQTYMNTDELCGDLERNFLEIRGFCRGQTRVFRRRSRPAVSVFPGIC
jgi:hypothetical protein